MDKVVRNIRLLPTSQPALACLRSVRLGRQLVLRLPESRVSARICKLLRHQRWRCYINLRWSGGLWQRKATRVQSGSLRLRGWPSECVS